MLLVISIALGLFLGPTTVQADSPPTCQSHDLELVPRSSEPPDFWEQREHPEISGKYVPLNEGFAFKFNSNVDATLGAQNISITGEAPKKDGKWLACDSEEANGVPLETHQVQLTVFNYLGMKNYLVVYHETDPFVFNCKYTIKITKDKPLSKDGHCLAADVEHPFQAQPDPRTPFERETTDIIYDLSTKEIRSFRIKPGVTIRPDEMISRYMNEFRLRLPGFGLDIMAPAGEPKKNPTLAGVQRVDYRQLYKGIPVQGGGLTVFTDKDGFVTSVSGRVVPGLNLDVAPKNSESTALEMIKTAIGAQEYLWDWKPDRYSPPKGELIIVSDGTSTTAESFRLAWRFNIIAHQPVLNETVIVDAQDPAGKILSRSTRIHAFDPPAVSDLLLQDPNRNRDGTGVTLFDGTRTDFKVSEYTDGTTLFQVLRTTVPVEITTFYDPGGGAPPKIIYDLDNVFDGVPGKPPGQMEGVSVHWSLQRAANYINTLFGTDIATGTDSVFPTSARIFAIVSDDFKAFGSPGLALTDYDGLVLEQIGLPPSPALLFDLKPSEPNRQLDAAVSPSIVGHELHHWLMNYFYSGINYTPVTAIVYEALADVFGKILEFSIRGDRGSWIKHLDIDEGGIGGANMADPKLSCSGTCPRPNAFGGDLYSRIKASCQADTDPYCGTYDKAIIIDHAFYLMAQGGEATNDLGCHYQVAPLDWENLDPVKSRDKLAILHWLASTFFLPSDVDLASLRTAVIQTARATFPNTQLNAGPNSLAPETKTVMDAFAAVGIGSSSFYHNISPQPPEGSKKVEPWPAGIGFVVGLQAETFQIQISPRLQFDQDIQEGEFAVPMRTLNVPNPEGGVLVINGANFYLKPDTTYYWRSREKPEDPNLEWGKCDPVFFFTTGSKAPKLINPEPPTRLVQLREAGASGSGGSTETVHTLAYGDSIKWEPVERATKYRYGISESPDGSVDFKWSGEVIGGTYFKPEEAGIHLLPEKTYYIYLQALSLDDQQNEIEGDWSYGGEGVPFKTTKIPAPTLSSPANGAALEYQETAYNGTTFTWEPPTNWTPPAGSEEKYRLTIYHRKEDGSAGSVITGTDVTARTTTLRGYYSENGYCWSVHAIGPDKSAGTESTTSCYSIHISAPQIVYPTNGSFGFYAPSDNNYAARFTWQATGGFFPDADKNGFHITIYNLNGDGSRGGLKYEHNFYSADVGIDNSGAFQYYTEIPGISDNHYGLCWSVHSFVNNGSLKSEESPVACYTMLPNKPTNLSPSGTGQDFGTVLFQWKNNNAPKGYTFTLTGTVGTQGHVDHDPSTDIQKVGVNGIKADGKYDWTITALSPDPANPDSLFSASAHFETKKEEQPPAPKPTTKPTTPPCTPPAAPPSPFAYYPGNYGECTQMWGVYSNNFTWSVSPGATKYKLSLSGFPDQIYDAASICANGYCMSPVIGPFSSGVCYTWTVSAGVEGCGQISWSAFDPLPLSFMPW